MNRYVKDFLLRGALFGGLGPVILGIVYAFLQRMLPDFSLSGDEVLLGIVSIYLLAFVQAGASVFQQVEHWPLPKATLFHFLTLYVAYAGCYLVNTWIPFRPEVLLIFTGIFAGGYFLVWLIVVLTLRSVSRRMNERLKRRSEAG